MLVAIAFLMWKWKKNLAQPSAEVEEAMTRGRTTETLV